VGKVFVFFTGHESVDYVTTFCLYVHHLVAGSMLKITKHLINILVNFGWNVSFICNWNDYVERICKEVRKKLGNAKNFVSASIYTGHMGSRWYTSDLHQLPMTFKNLFHHGTKACILT